MIIPANFNVLRSRAIDKLPKETKYDSFGYHIDVQSQWEHVYSNTELLYYLGIHLTHESRFSELCFDLKAMKSNLFKKQATFHLEIIEATSKIISTNKSDYPNIKYDLGELFMDWDFIRDICGEIKVSLDFGAGCGRQLIGLLHNCKHFHTLYAIDASTNGYMTQNCLYTACDILGHVEFIDLLDYEQSGALENGVSRVNGENSKKPKVVHVPAWTDYSHIRDKSLDIIFACHVHNELSKSDFLRLMELADTKIRDGGYFYIRSELGIWGDNFYEDSVMYHAIDPVEKLSSFGFEVIKCRHVGGFQTTLFQRRSSARRGLMTSVKKLNPFEKASYASFANFKECSFAAAKDYNVNNLCRVAAEYKNKVIYVQGTYADLDVFFPTNLLNSFKVVSVEEFNGQINDDEVLVIANHDFHSVENMVAREKLAKRTRLQYTFPLVIYLPEKFDLNIEQLSVISQ